MATGIIYGEQSGIIRRVITAEFASRLYLHVGPGEALLVWFEGDIPEGNFPDADAARLEIERVRGQPSESDRCLVISNATGEIEAVIAADPSIDALDGKTIWQDDVAVPGDDLGALAAP